MQVKKPKWWRRRRTIILGVIAALVLIPTIFVLFRWRSNVVLARQLRAEIDAWLKTIPKIPDSENGALPILSGLEAFKDGLPDRLYDHDFSVENESDKTLLKQYLAEKEPALAQIYEGLGYKKFLFPDDYRKGYSREISWMFRLRRAALLLELKGNLLESEGKKSEAFNEYLNILRLGETLSSGRDMVSRLLGAGILGMAFEPLTRMLSERSVGEKDISTALDLLIDLHGERGNFFGMIEAEYYFFLMLVADITEGKIDFFDALSAFDPGKHEKSVLGRILFSKYVYDYRYDVEIWRKAARIWRSTDPAKYYALPPEAESGAFLKAVGLPVTGIYAILTRLPLPALIRQMDRLAATEALWRGTIALSAIRLFEAQQGRLPKNLKELSELVPRELLIDPFSGNEIIYRLEGDDFYLYSVGLDGVDGNAASGLPYFKEKGALYKMPDIIFHAPPASER